MSRIRPFPAMATVLRGYPTESLEGKTKFGRWFSEAVLPESFNRPAQAVYNPATLFAGAGRGPRLPNGSLAGTAQA
jgi:hypothetical protein